MAILARLGLRQAMAAACFLAFGAFFATVAQAGSNAGGGDGGLPFGLNFMRPLFGPAPLPADNPPPQRIACKAPSYYSPQLGRCVLPAKAVTCTYPLVKQGQSCVCAPGYSWSGGKCFKPQTPAVAKAAPPPPVVADKLADPAPDKPPASDVDVAHIQRCLAKLGYDPGVTDGDIGASTRTAFRTYQEENGLGSQPFNLTDQATQQKLFKMCEAGGGPRTNSGSTTARP
jgi:hypothetical protein